MQYNNTIQSKFIDNRRHKKAGARARLLGRGAGNYTRCSMISAFKYL